jgi:hypothetical protein
MCLHSSVADFSYAVGFLSMAMIRHSHGQELPPSDELESSLNDAAIAAAELTEMGQQNVIAAMMVMCENVSWWGSALTEYEDHQQQCMNLHQAILNRIELLQANSDDDEEEVKGLIPDEVYGDVNPEHLEHIKHCFSL